MFIALKRIIRAGFVGFWRSAYVSMASVFVISVSLFVIGGTIILDQLLTNTLNDIQKKVDINLYFVPEATDADIQNIRTLLSASPEVAEVIYTTREDALAQYRSRNMNNTVALQALDELGTNPLGASLAIRANDTSQYESIASFLEDQISKQPGVIDTFNYQDNKQAIETLSGIIAAVERASYAAMILLIGIAIAITFNTVRLAIYTAREEISIMRLVGASNAYIRGPFLLQGIMYGVIATVFAMMVLYPLTVWLGPFTASFFQFNIAEYFVSSLGSIFLTLVTIGVVTGLVSSLLAIRRYLKV